MKKSWLISLLLSPCIAFAGYFDADEYEELDFEESYAQEEICEHCGAALARDSTEEIAARDDYEMAERRQSPSRRRSSPNLGTQSRFRHPREKAESDRPQVVQRQLPRYRNQYKERIRENDKQGDRVAKKGGSSSATIGSLSRKSKNPREVEETSSRKHKSKLERSKKKEASFREDGARSSGRPLSSSKSSKRVSQNSKATQRQKRARLQKGESDSLERQDLRGKHKNFSIH